MANKTSNSMSQQKVFISIPLLIAAGLLIYCWLMINTTDLIVTWRHYIGLILFILLVLLFFKSVTKSLLATGVFLLLATFNLLAITPQITTSWLGFDLGSARISTPPIQLLSLGLLVLYFILNQASLINIYLDYKEGKELRVQTTTAKNH